MMPVCVCDSARTKRAKSAASRASLAEVPDMWSRAQRSAHFQLFRSRLLIKM